MRGVASKATITYLFVLKLPIVIQLGIVVRYAALVCGVVEAIRCINQERGTRPDNFVSMRNTWRNQDLPGAQIAYVERISLSKSRRFGTEVDQNHLKHIHGRRPAIGLMAMEMECLDDSGIIQRGGDLGRLFWEVRVQSKSGALNFEEVAPIVGPKRDWSAFNALDQFGRVGSQNDIANAFFALRERNRDFRVHAAA